jgi:hypothetical protein
MFSGNMLPSLSLDNKPRTEKNGMDRGRRTGTGTLSKHTGIRRIIKEYATCKRIIFQGYEDLEK